MKLSIIIPVLNEAQQISACLKPLQHLRNAGNEIIVVDGGSHDATADIALPYCDQLIHTKPGRALQMNTGAKNANGDYLLFLHADTYLPNQLNELTNACTTNALLWGRFDVRLSGRHFLFRIIERAVSLRSRLTGIATGDQAIFVHKKLFEQLGGYPEIPLMEDIALSRLLNKKTKPVCLKSTVTTSSRRWEVHGIIKTMMMMWAIRLLYYFNYHPNKLAALYKAHEK